MYGRTPVYAQCCTPIFGRTLCTPFFVFYAAVLYMQQMWQTHLYEEGV